MTQLDRLYREALRHRSVRTRDMDPDSHAYYQERPSGSGGEWVGDEDGYRLPKREWDPNQGWLSNPQDDELREQVQDDDDSGYNWGPAPDYDPRSEPGPDPNFVDGNPLSFDTPIYNPRSERYSDE